MSRRCLGGVEEVSGKCLIGALPRLQGLYLQSNRLGGSLAALRQRVLCHLPLQNLALGANAFDLAEASELASELSGSAARAVTSSGHSGAARIGFGWDVSRKCLGSV